LHSNPPISPPWALSPSAVSAATSAKRAKENISPLTPQMLRMHAAYGCLLISLPVVPLAKTSPCPERVASPPPLGTDHCFNKHQLHRVSSLEKKFDEFWGCGCWVLHRCVDQKHSQRAETSTGLTKGEMS
jgi:hypothetical protein